MSLLCQRGCRHNGGGCGQTQGCVNACNCAGNQTNACNTTCNCAGNQTNACNTTCNCDTVCTCQKVCDCESQVEAAETVTPTCTCNCTCTCTCPSSQTATEAEQLKPVTVRALLQSVMDSCCTTDDVCREITVECPDIFDPCRLEVGSSLNVELDGDITYKEVTRNKDDCVCVSTVKFNIPIRIYGTDKCCCDRYISRTITVIRSVKLCCARDSELVTNNTKVIAASAVVTAICGDAVTFTLCLLFRSCVQQVIVREYSWLATPVCTAKNCNDARNQLLDPCDVICGCTAGAGYTCPSC